MSFNEMVLSAVTPIVPVCVPDILVPEAGEEVPDTYCVFSGAERLTWYGDDEPEAVLYRGELLLVLPRDANPDALKRALRRALLDAGCALGESSAEVDTEVQVWSIPFEWLSGEV